MDAGTRKPTLTSRGLKRELDTTRRTIQKLSFKAEDGIQTYSPPTERVTKLPRLTGQMTIREKTVIKPATKFSDHVETFFHEVANVSEKSIALARKKCKALMTLISPRLRGNKSFIQFRDPIFVGSVYDNLVVLNNDEVEVLLPFEVGNISVETLEAGYVCIALPKLKKGRYDDEDKWLYGRADDERHLSPIKTIKSIYKIIERAMRHPFEIENVELTPLMSDDADHPCRILIIVNERLKVHITPTVIQKDARGQNTHKPYLVIRPYAYDEHPMSDIRWRCNYWAREAKITNTVSSADRGIRQKAFRAFKAFILLDPRLAGLTSYQLKTVFLHFLDDDVEFSPRWQRDSVEPCFRALLQNFGEFLRRGSLPHFFMSGVNLFDNMSEKTLAVIRGRVLFLVNNEKEVIRMMRKRPKKEKKPRTRVQTRQTDQTIASRLDQSISQRESLLSQIIPESPREGVASQETSPREVATSSQMAIYTSPTVESERSVNLNKLPLLTK